jgi:hypothetical protein
MSIVYRCPACGEEHRSRLLATRRSYFHEVVSQLGDILELCPATGGWTALTFADMNWRADERLSSGAFG